MIAGVRKGLYVTELIGATANTVTGDYSSGAAGLWIENGELAYPVSEITIAGNLKQMLMDLSQVASNLEFRGSIASPTIMIQEMTISGRWLLRANPQSECRSISPAARCACWAWAVFVPAIRPAPGRRRSFRYRPKARRTSRIYA